MAVAEVGVVVGQMWQRPSKLLRWRWAEGTVRVGAEAGGVLARVRQYGIAVDPKLDFIQPRRRVRSNGVIISNVVNGIEGLVEGRFAGKKLLGTHQIQ